jgi:hypothetical protein
MNTSVTDTSASVDLPPMSRPTTSAAAGTRPAAAAPCPVMKLLAEAQMARMAVVGSNLERAALPQSQQEALTQLLRLMKSVLESRSCTDGPAGLGATAVRTRCD